MHVVNRFGIVSADVVDPSVTSTWEEVVWVITGFCSKGDLRKALAEGLYKDQPRARRLFRVSRN